MRQDHDVARISLESGNQADVCECDEDVGGDAIDQSTVDDGRAELGTMYFATVDSAISMPCMRSSP